MGCDGGTIPKRDELVKTKKKPEQKDKASELSFRWCHCSITQQPLQKPIVACGLGRLYSKISVLEALLDRTLLPDTASHLKNIKDVKELKLTLNPAFSAKAEKGDGYIDRQCSEYICPTIGLEMNGKFKFCFLWTCGCVMSERALKEIKDKICLQKDDASPFKVELAMFTLTYRMLGEDFIKNSKLLKVFKKFLKVPTVCYLGLGYPFASCFKTLNKLRAKSYEGKALVNKVFNGRKKHRQEYCTDDVVTLNASEEDLMLMGKRLEVRQARQKALKKDNKQKLKGDAKDSGTSQNSKESKTLPTLPSQASVSKHGKAEPAKPEGKRGAPNKELFDPAFKKAKSEYSVSKDPNATDVYKSLFTTSSKAQNQTKAHWVTYNPFYN